MKIKTQDLIGPALDWAVWSIEFKNAGHGDDELLVRALRQHYEPSTSGDTVIDIMEREGICVDAGDDNYPPERRWSAWYALDAPVRAEDEVVGPTVRIAVCRCFVASNLGDEIDVPEELLK